MRSGGLALLLLVGAGCGRSFSKPLSANPLPPLQAVVEQTTVAPRGRTAIHVAGGKAPYHLALSSQGSGATATVDDQGRYQAGDQGPAIDLIRITDAAGDEATTSVTVGPGLALFPPQVATVPQGEVTFVASGGQPPYTFALAQGGNTSWGAMQSSGLYTAGPNPDETDTITVTDANGVVRTASVAVGEASLGTVQAGVHLVRGDWNGDGIEDAVAYDSEGLVQVILGRHSGPVLTQKLVLPSGFTPLVGDFDGDGCDDLFLRWPSHEALFVHGRRDGTFAAGRPFTIDISASSLVLSEPALAPVDLRPAIPQVLLAGLASSGVPTSRVAAFAEAPDDALEDGGLGLTPLREVYGTDLYQLFSALQPAAHSDGHAVLVDDFFLGGLLYLPGFRVDPDGGGVTMRDPVLNPWGNSTPMFTEDPLLADVNGDGLPDFGGRVSVAASPAAWYARPGFSDGGFGFVQVVATGVRVVVPAPADGTHASSRMLGLSDDGGFEILGDDGGYLIRPTPVPAEAYALLAGDFDGDGESDLLESTAEGELRILRADARGQYQTGRRFAVRPPGAMGFNPVMLSVGDLDHDGRADAIAADLGAAVLTGTPDGRLSHEAALAPGTTLLASAITDAGAFVAVQALDGKISMGPVRRGASGWELGVAPLPFDVAPDSVTPLNAGGAVPGADLLVHLVNNNPPFALERVEPDGGLQTLLITTFPDGYLYPLALSDAGIDDLVYEASTEPSQIELHPVSSAAQVTWQSSPSAVIDGSAFGTDGGLFLAGTFASVVGGAPDTVLVGDWRNRGAFAVDPRTGAGVRVPDAVNLGAPLGFTYGRPFAAADLNGDGRTDLVMFDQSPWPQPWKLVTAIRAEDGGFLTAVQPMRFGIFSVVELATGDVDGDGLSDVVVYDATQASLNVYLTRLLPDGGVTLQ